MPVSSVPNEIAREAILHEFVANEANHVDHTLRLGILEHYPHAQAGILVTVNGDQELLRRNKRNVWHIHWGRLSRDFQGLGEKGL